MLGDERCRRARRRDPWQLVRAPTARSSATTSSARSTARRRPATTSGRCSSTAARRAPAPARRRCIPATTSCGSTARPTRTSTARTIRSPSPCRRWCSAAHRITAHVTQIDGAGHSTPIAGARVAGATDRREWSRAPHPAQRRHDHAPGAAFRGDAVGSGVCLRLRPQAFGMWQRRARTGGSCGRDQ